MRITCREADDPTGGGWDHWERNGYNEGRKIVVKLYDDLGDEDWGDKSGDHGGGSSANQFTCLFEKAEANAAICEYLAANYPNLTCPPHGNWFLDNDCLKELCEAKRDGRTEGIESCIDDDLVRRMLKFSVSQWLCIKSNTAIEKKVIDLLNSNLVDPCDPTKMIDEKKIVSDILYKICSEVGDKNKKFDEELAKNDYIIILPSFSNNSRLKCLWEKYMTADRSGESPLFCNLLVPIINSKAPLVLDAQNEPDSETRSQVSSKDGNLYLSVNTHYSDNNCDIYVHKTLIHEIFHAFIDKIIIESNNNLDEIDKYLPGYKKHYEERIVVLNANENFVHQDYMAKYYMSKFVQEFKVLYGNIYTDLQKFVLCFGKAWKVHMNISYYQILKNWKSIN